MHTCSRKTENGLEEPARKRRRVSADAEVVKNSCKAHAYFNLEIFNVANYTLGKRRRYLKGLQSPQHCQRISTEDLVEDWLSGSGWSRQRTSSVRMSHLPSPLGTTSAVSQKLSGTATASSRSSLKSVASVQDSNYRETLEQYHIYVMEEPAPSELLERAEEIITRRRETPELDDAAVRELKSTMRQLQNRGEEDVKNSLGAVIVPDFKALPSNKLDGLSGQLWTKAIPIPLDCSVLAEPLPLLKPKPDKAFGYAKVAFNSSQLPIINLLA